MHGDGDSDCPFCWRVSKLMHRNNKRGIRSLDYSGDPDNVGRVRRSD